MNGSRELRPGAGLSSISAYSVPRAPTPVDLHLDGNEGMTPANGLLRDLATQDVELVRRYPTTEPLERQLARRLGIEREQLLVTAGADDALDRVCRAFLEPGRELVLPEPTFEMLTRYPAVLGADICSIPWRDGEFPRQAVLDAITPRTGVVALVTPNNPTGAVATGEDLVALATAAPHAAIIVDHAYVEYGGQDLTHASLAFPNVVVTRSLSKAYGLAGLRLGYAVAQPDLIQWLRAAGSPYPVAGLSVALACEQLARCDDDLTRHVACIRGEREALLERLRSLDTEPSPSQANFVLTRCRDSMWLRDAMAGLGIAVRAFPGRPGLEDAVRITCPGDADDLARLEHALATALAPEALLFDMDGVLADVSGSYRQTIVATAAAYGVALTADDVTEAKARGDANNDWVLTHRLLHQRGVDVDLAEVTERFEALYQGDAETPGLRQQERLLIDRDVLERLSRSRPLAVVTGRPRSDTVRFLEEQGVADLFAVAVCMEDAPAKPDPTCVRVALERLGVCSAWMIGDTPDDIRAARGARVLPVGVPAPGDGASRMADALLAAGAGRVLENPADLEALLP